MKDDTERYLGAVAVTVVVAAFALWKDVGAIAAMAAVLSAGLVYSVVDQLMSRHQPAPPAVAVAQLALAHPAPRRATVSSPKITEAGAVVGMMGAAEASSHSSATLDLTLLDPNSVEMDVTSASTASPVWSVRIAKHGQAIDECEDAVRIDHGRWVMAVADGASSSFGARQWAKTLADEFVAAPPQPLSPGSFEAWIDRCRTAVMAGESAGQGGWWSEEGARRGAFATLVGAAVHGKKHERVVTVMCVGDSCAFVLGGEVGQRVLRRALPYEDASQFGSHPNLIGSLAEHGAIAPSWTTMAVGGGEVLVLASDAVSEWLLADHRRFAQIDQLSQPALADFLIAERAAGRIVNDDLTVALLGLS